MPSACFDIRVSPRREIRIALTGFTDAGAAGQNSFKFTGRLGASALKPGRYRLAGSAGGEAKRVNFKIIG